MEGRVGVRTGDTSSPVPSIEGLVVQGTRAAAAAEGTSSQRAEGLRREEVSPPWGVGVEHWEPHAKEFAWCRGQGEPPTAMSGQGAALVDTGFRRAQFAVLWAGT